MEGLGEQGRKISSPISPSKTTALDPDLVIHDRRMERLTSPIAAFPISGLSIVSVYGRNWVEM
jgi:hypothetical protein